MAREDREQDRKIEILQVKIDEAERRHSKASEQLVVVTRKFAETLKRYQTAELHEMERFLPALQIRLTVLRRLAYTYIAYREFKSEQMYELHRELLGDIIGVEFALLAMPDMNVSNWVK
jgi:hypothetical protein